MSKPEYDGPHWNQKTQTWNGTCVYFQVEIITARETCSENLWEQPRGLVFRSYRVGKDSWLTRIGDKLLFNLVMAFSIANKLPWSWLPIGSPSLDMPNQRPLPGINQRLLWSFYTTWSMHWRTLESQVSDYGILWLGHQCGFFSSLLSLANTLMLAEVGTSIKWELGRIWVLEFCQGIGLWLMNDLSVAWRRKPVHRTPPSCPPPPLHKIWRSSNEWMENRWIKFIWNISGFKD